MLASPSGDAAFCSGTGRGQTCSSGYETRSCAINPSLTPRPSVLGDRGLRRSSSVLRGGHAAVHGSADGFWLEWAGLELPTLNEGFSHRKSVLWVLVLCRDGFVFQGNCICTCVCSVA